MNKQDNFNSSPEFENIPINDKESGYKFGIKPTFGIGSGEEEVRAKVFDFWSVVRRRYWIIIAFFVVVVGLTTFITFKLPLTYSAVATLRIYTENPKVLKFEEVVAQTSFDRSMDAFYKTQTGIIKSRSLARNLIKDLGLVEHPEFEDDVSFLNKIIYHVLSFFRKNDNRGKKTDITNHEDRKMYWLVTALTKRISVVSVGRSQLFNIAVDTKYPELSTKICNTLVEMYIQRTLEIKSATETIVSRALSGQIESLKIRLEESEIALNEYAKENDIIALTETEDILNKRISEIVSYMTEAKADQITKEAQYLQLKNGSSANSLRTALNDAVLNDLYVKYSNAKVEYESQLTRIKGKHPLINVLKEKMNTIKNSIDERLKILSDSVKALYDEAVLKEDRLAEEFEVLEKERMRVEDKSVQYKMLNREVVANTELYDGLLQRMKETDLSSEVKAANIQIVDLAEIPLKHSKPKRKRNILLSILVGLVFGIILAFFFDYLDNTIRSPDEVEQRLRLPLLGYIPIIKELNGKHQKQGDFVTHLNPKSTVSEAYRTIRTGVLFSSPDTKLRNIMVTSAYPEEGKTITSINLAIVLAQSGNRVLLVDTDLRRPRLHKAFDVKNDQGVCNLLVNDIPLDDVVKQTEIPNLDILVSGPIPPNPTELLGSKSMDLLLSRLNERYDKVIFDTPPVVSVTDATILAAKVDACIEVIMAGRSDISSILQGKNLIQSVGGRIIGVVLNAVSKTSHEYYNRYHYYYGHEDEKERKKIKKRVQKI